MLRRVVVFLQFVLLGIALELFTKIFESFGQLLTFKNKAF